MTARIYTIPARDVVPGMLWRTAAGCIWRPIVDVTKRVHGCTLSVEDAHGVGQYDYECDGPAEIALPGPSPRELLCNCALSHTEIDGAASPVDGHLFTCPVYRLRLRLWPVGATWRAWEHGEGGWWVVPVDGRPDVTVPVCNVRDGLVYYEQFGCADKLRAAFCEPEVQL